MPVIVKSLHFLLLHSVLWHSVNSMQAKNWWMVPHRSVISCYSGKNKLEQLLNKMVYTAAIKVSSLSTISFFGKWASIVIGTIDIPYPGTAWKLWGVAKAEERVAAGCQLPFDLTCILISAIRTHANTLLTHVRLRFDLLWAWMIWAWAKCYLRCCTRSKVNFSHCAILRGSEYGWGLFLERTNVDKKGFGLRRSNEKGICGFQILALCKRVIACHGRPTPPPPLHCVFYKLD